MAKRQIYFDDRERKLARVCLRGLLSQFKEDTRKWAGLTPLLGSATGWFRNDVEELLVKFKEPDTSVPQEPDTAQRDNAADPTADVGE